MKVAKPTRKSPRRKPTLDAGRLQRVAESMVNIEVLSPRQSFTGNQQNGCEPDLPDFEHEPLDLSKPFIRLLKVAPTLSAGGLLQCQLSNNKKLDSSTYTCLSYMWGIDPPSKWIVVNGKKFAVRENLWSFLNVARTKYPRKALWIDALCINQDRIKERNHQVGQMGRIYSAARQTVVWLGDSEALADFFQSLIAIDPLGVDVVRNLRELRSGWRLLADHEYWTRAWITQELALSSNCSVLAADTDLDASQLHELHHKANFPKRHNRKLRSNLELQISTQGLQTTPLMTLLLTVPDQACAVRRDRVYSLLSLAEEGKHITVDYGMSDEDFFFSLVKVCAHSMCLCSIHLIAKVLGLKRFESDTPTSSPIPIAETVIHPIEKVTFDSGPEGIFYYTPLQYEGYTRIDVPTLSTVFAADTMCELFSGWFYIEDNPIGGQIKPTEIICCSGSRKRPVPRLTNGDLSSGKFGMGLKPRAAGGYTFQTNLSTLLQFPCFRRCDKSRSLCANAKNSSGCFRILERSE
jgi:hypothetical protein